MYAQNESNSGRHVDQNILFGVAPFQERAQVTSSQLCGKLTLTRRFFLGFFGPLSKSAPLTVW